MPANRSLAAAPEPGLPQDLRSWLSALGLGKYADAFLAQDISPDLLPELSDADLRELGVVSLGDRKRLLRAAARLVADLNPHPRANVEPPVAIDS